MKYQFVIGTNATTDVSVGTIGSITTLYQVPFNFRWDIVGAGSATRTRNVLANRFLKDNEAPYLIFIDRDMVFTPKDMQKLYKDLEDGYDLIAGCYTIKTTMRLTSGCARDGDLFLDGSIKEVKYLGTGFMGITRKLIEKMVKELALPLMHEGGGLEAYPLFEERRHEDIDFGWMWLSEDYDFCHKARDVGVRSYLDTSIKIRHVGEALWRVDDTIESKHRRTLSEEAQKAITEILKREALPVGP